jgi:signal transduction histidine kinase/ActR/RegA family two-component response regulator
MISAPGEISAIQVENDTLRSQLAEAQVLLAREIQARRDNEHVRSALAAGGVIGTWNWHPTKDSFTVDLGFTIAFGIDESFVHREVPIAQVLDNVHPEDRPGLDAAIVEAVARKGGYAHPYRVKRADGKYYWLQATGRVETDKHGQPVSFPGFVIDITERRAAEERLRISEALTRESVQRVQLALAAGAIIGTWNWDLPTDRFTVDEAFAVAFGLDPALGRDGIPLAQIVATVHPDDQAGLAEAIKEAIARGGRYAHQYRVKRADGNFYWLEANGRVDHGADGTPLSFPGVLIDVEARRAVEAERDRAITQLRSLNETLEQRVAERSSELMEAQDRLRQSQKMEAVGQLTGGLAHDFNNLLAGISGSLELMQARLQQGRINDVERYMAAAQGASKRAAALTHRLLAFSRRQTLDPKPTDVNRLINGMQEMIQRTVGPGIAVEVIGASGLWPACVDVSQLENSLLNLCINARDAMPDGGRITIETTNKWFDRHAAQRYLAPEGQYLCLSVTDTGSGMSPVVIARAFEPFFTTKPIGEGTGLGLSMIYGFAQQSGGQVRIHSTVGLGTTVNVYLPRHYGEVTHEAHSAERAALPRSEQGETVLVVDDEPTVRMLVTDILEELGYVAIEAGDSAAGLRVLQSNVRIDLLVTDVGLPGGLNGRQMADAARVSRPNLKVLFITGYAENAILGNGYLAADMAVLTKPFLVETMALRIRSMIESNKQ